jgi:hypothetical protein
MDVAEITEISARPAYNEHCCPNASDNNGSSEDLTGSYLFETLRQEHMRSWPSHIAHISMSAL